MLLGGLALQLALLLEVHLHFFSVDVDQIRGVPGKGQLDLLAKGDGWWSVFPGLVGFVLLFEG